MNTTKTTPLYPERSSDCNGCDFYGDVEAQAQARMIHQVEEAARYLAMGLTLVASCFVPHWRVTSQNMSLRCDMAAHLEAGKEYDLSSLVMNANGNCAKCKQPIVKTHLFATCPCGRSEVRLFGNVGEDPGVRFDHHNDPDGDPCEYGGSKVATAHAHEEFFAHLAATFNRLD